MFRWSAVEQDHLNPVFLDGEPQRLAYSASQDRLYISQASGAILEVGPTGTLPASFATTPTAAVELLATGARLYVPQANSYSIFEPDGTLLVAANGSTRGSVWNGTLSRIYHGPNALSYLQIDPATGLLDGGGSWRWDVDLRLTLPLVVSPDGARVASGLGDVFDAVSLDRLGSIADEPIDMAFSPDGALVAIVGSAEEGTRISQWDTAYAPANLAWVPGAPLRIFAFDGGMVVVTLLEGMPAFHLYVPGNDGDGDGVPFDADAFPLDAAASLDGDRDGAPDAWNPGRSQADSTTGLVLDAFPTTASCQSAEQALPGEPDASILLYRLDNVEPDEMMPEIGRSTIHAEGVELIRAWIESLPGDCD